MTFIKKTALFFTFCILASAATYAQVALSNKEIINLQASKISQDIILAKISSTKCQFDLTAQGLIDLKAGKISDKVMKAMFAASPPTETMNNEDVIKLSDSDVSSTILKEKISKTAHKFDVGSEALIKLKAAKVSDSVVKGMILNPIQGNALSVVAAATSTTATVPVGPTTPAMNVKTNAGAISWEQVIVTNALEEVKGLTRVGEISASASRAYGKEERLRKEAIEKLKKEAVSKGATHVLLQSNSFAPTPFNTVSLGGVCYKK